MLGDTARHWGALMAFAALASGLSMMVRGPGALPGAFAVAILASWVHLAAHELGHAAAARLVGFRLWAVVVGPLSIARDLRGTLRVQRGVFAPVGWVRALARDLENLTARIRWFAAGGPLANLALLVAGFWLPDVFGLPMALIATTMGIAALFAMFEGVSGIDPDWRQIVAPRPHLPGWAWGVTVSATLEGKRLSEVVSLEALADIPEDDEGRIGLMWMVLCGELSDERRGNERRERLLATLDRAAAPFKTDLALQLGAWEALVRGDVEAADRCLESARASSSEAWYPELLAAAIARGKGQDDAAESTLAAWRARLAEQPNPAFSAGGTHWILARLGRAGGAEAAAVVARSAADAC